MPDRHGGKRHNFLSDEIHPTPMQRRDQALAFGSGKIGAEAHARAGNESTQSLVAGPAQFEGFQVVQEVRPDGSKVRHAKD